MAPRISSAIPGLTSTNFANAAQPAGAKLGAILQLVGILTISTVLVMVLDGILHLTNGPCAILGMVFNCEISFQSINRHMTAKQ